MPEVLVWILAAYFAAINLAAFIAFGVDKRRAIKDKWRIRERTLLFLAALGGSLGALAGMRLFHHKTLKKKFSVVVPAILFLQLLAAACVWYTLKR